VRPTREELLRNPRHDWPLAPTPLRKKTEESRIAMSEHLERTTEYLAEVARLKLLAADDNRVGRP
jgi:hypothetical protein